MDRFIYVAASGTDQIMRAQSVNAHNLANANTTGFRADLAQFHSKPVYGDGQPSRVFAVAESSRWDLDEGDIKTTGRELDIAVAGEGWIAVQNAEGKEAYTRAGDLHLSAEGLLMTGSNQLVLGNGGPVAIPPAEKIEVGEDGTISIRPLGQSAEGMAQVDRIKLAKPPTEQLEKREDGLFYRKDNKPTPLADDVTIVSGALEGSNVDAVGTLMSIIDLSRQYEMQVKMMKIAEDASDSSAQIMQV